MERFTWVRGQIGFVRSPLTHVNLEQKSFEVTIYISDVSHVSQSDKVKHMRRTHMRRTHNLYATHT